ncbi:hypothetical protein Xoosp13_1 [Xanthomonas phage Xoo-sp13]|nr:hypothetical protein Xoosp13_1 [Xanthomonas phage Xoo-sp13]
MKTTKQILTEARDAILANPHNLGKGLLVARNPDADGGLCFCALGHIAKAAGCKVVINPEDEYGNYIAFDTNYAALNRLEAVKALANTISPRDVNDGYCSPSNIIFRFNDIKRQSPQLIVDMFNKAIDSLP